MKITVMESAGGRPTDSEIDEIMKRTQWYGNGDSGWQEPDYADRVSYVKGALKGLKFPLRLWRGLRVPPGKELRMDTDVGTHWTYKYEMFDQNKSGEWFTADKLNVILSGIVTESQVNWRQTVQDLASDYDPKRGYAGRDAEYEIELRRGEIPGELEIWSDYR